MRINIHIRIKIFILFHIQRYKLQHRRDHSLFFVKKKTQFISRYVHTVSLQIRNIYTLFIRPFYTNLNILK
jgi:hypothetical protein